MNPQPVEAPTVEDELTLRGEGNSPGEPVRRQGTTLDATPHSKDSAPCNPM
jgi:hypothetical protein